MGKKQQQGGGGKGSSKLSSAASAQASGSAVRSKKSVAITNETEAQVKLLLQVRPSACTPNKS